MLTNDLGSWPYRAMTLNWAGVTQPKLEICVWLSHSLDERWNVHGDIASLVAGTRRKEKPADRIGRCQEAIGKSLAPGGWVQIVAGRSSLGGRRTAVAEFEARVRRANEQAEQV